MTFKLIPKRHDFCRYAVEAWVVVGFMCERRTFYGNNSSNVRARALFWVKQWIAHAA